MLQYVIAVLVFDGVAFGIPFLHPISQVDADPSGNADGGQENRRNPVGSPDDWGNVDEGDVRTSRFAGPKGDVVDSGHTGGSNPHGSLFGNQHNPLTGMVFLEFLNLRLRFLGNQAFSMQFAIGTGVSLIAWRKQVRGNVSDCRYVSHDFNFLLHFRQFREKLTLGITFEDFPGKSIALLVGFLQSVRIRFIEENLSLQNLRRFPGDRCVFAQRQVE